MTQTVQFPRLKLRIGVQVDKGHGIPLVEGIGRGGLVEIPGCPLALRGGQDDLLFRAFLQFRLYLFPDGKRLWHRVIVGNPP